jgi:hypothetical protein
MIDKTTYGLIGVKSAPKPRAKMSRKEESLQTAICRYLKLQYPNVIFHCDHGGAKKRSFAEQGVMKKQQYKAGYPDMQVLKPVGKWHGLFLEVKKSYDELFYVTGELKPGPSDHFYSQDDMHYELVQNGYAACFIWSLEDAIRVIDRYMNDRLAFFVRIPRKKPSIHQLNNLTADEFFKDRI